jgi:hypothetical protein
VSRSKNRGAEGRRERIGGVRMRLAVCLPPGAAVMRAAGLLLSYVVSTHTIAMHTSCILRT